MCDQLVDVVEHAAAKRELVETKPELNLFHEVNKDTTHSLFANARS